MGKYNFKLTIAYDGNRYLGWQRLSDSDMTIQGKLETILYKLFGEEIEVIGQGRTDAGVHAKKQIANFWITGGMLKDSKVTAKLLDAGVSLKIARNASSDVASAIEALYKYFNHYLPDDIAVTEIENADERFHSRYLAKEKWYRYRLLNSDIPNVFERKYVFQNPDNYNIENMRKAAKSLVGEYDFSAFTTAKKTKKSNVRTIYSIDINSVKIPGGEEIVFDFRGDGFLYNMVRILVGTLIEVGMGQKSVNDVENILDEGVRQNAGFLAPACGLTLMEVKY